ncbi:hypothetical protein ACWEQU_03705 [Streptomyces nodosus]
MTTRYPERPDASAGSLPTPPAFRADRLTPAVADRLVAACPSTALSRRAGVLVYDVGACTACGRCRQEVPEAVVDSGVFELAALTRGHLVKEIVLRGGGSGTDRGPRERG